MAACESSRVGLHSTDLAFRYTQCELMSSHYDKPMLLIEFEEHKAFSLEVRFRNFCPQA